jgi:CRP-like cAMP-binding protein
MTTALTRAVTGVPGNVATLTVYVEQGCPSCHAAREVAERVRAIYPEVKVLVVDLGDVSSEEVPPQVFAAPTFLLDGEVVSLGTPAWETLTALLERAPDERDGPGGGDSLATSPTRSIVAPEPTPCLMESELFQDLGEREMTEIERSTTMSSCKRGTVFFAPEETGEVLFILKAGRVNLYRVTEEGKKLVTATLEPGSIFGEMALAGQGMNGSFAEAAEDCDLCLMSRADIQHVIHEYPAVALRLLEGMARRLDDAEERLADVAYKSVPTRIAATLLRLSGPDNRPVNLSHQDIADMVGTYRETATRILNEMRGDELVELKRMRISVTDRRRLALVASEVV